MTTFIDAFSSTQEAGTEHDKVVRKIGAGGVTLIAKEVTSRGGRPAIRQVVTSEAPESMEVKDNFGVLKIRVKLM